MSEANSGSGAGAGGATAKSYSYPIRLLERVGVELEYMIVDAESLDVRPIADEALKAVSGAYDSDATPELAPASDGTPIEWSNELALHVLEFKTGGPAFEVASLTEAFQRSVRHANGLLAPMGAMLLPTAMHPWMDPHAELRLWPHEYSPVYEAFNRIFDCQGHGWANLQSTHINLPFGDDAEFGALHAAIRLVLPLLPSLAASSPVMDGKVTGLADSRLNVYRGNARRVPSLSGRVIPERVFSRAAYEGELLAGLYRDIAPHDPDGILQHEFLNARGCIARFDRGAIEIRVIDVQECPAADIAIVDFTTELVRALAGERWASLADQQAVEIEPLFDVLLKTIDLGEEALVESEQVLAMFGAGAGPVRAGDLLQRLAEELMPPTRPTAETLRRVLRYGTLSTRIRRALGDSPTRTELGECYRRLGACLAEGRVFDPTE